MTTTTNNKPQATTTKQVTNTINKGLRLESILFHTSLLIAGVLFLSFTIV